MTGDGTTPIFERGDVVYGDDPFKNDESARPWLVLSNYCSIQNDAVQQ